MHRLLLRPFAASPWRLPWRTFLKAPPHPRPCPLTPTPRPLTNPAPQIGQQFSTRVDVLSPEFIKELEKLQVGGWRREGARSLPRGAGNLGVALACMSLPFRNAATPQPWLVCAAQDNVPAFESETAVAIIESSLGKPVRWEPTAA